MQSATRRLLGAAAAAVDLAVRRTTISRSGSDRDTRALRHGVRLALLARLLERYQKLGAFEHFFREARKITPIEDVRKIYPDGGKVVDVHWPADYVTFLPEIREKYDRVVQNHTATARLVLHDSPRPMLVLVHGYLGGIHRIERRIWPMSFLRGLGMDIALFVLPFHGRRSRGRLHELPPFPGPDVRISNEGFRQAVGDLMDFLQYLRGRGHEKIGLMGMSLGGFTTALTATVDSQLSFAVPLVPLASIADMAQLNGHIGAGPEEESLQYAALDAAYRITSPLHRTPLIAPERMLVIAGENDQITPILQARKLARHFKCRLETMPGGHLVQFGRADKFKVLARFLRDLDVLPGTR